MDQFSAAEFYAIASLLGGMKTFCEQSQTRGDKLEKKVIAGIEKWLNETESKCAKIGLHVSLDAARWMRGLVRRPGTTVVELAPAVEQLSNNIKWEMQRMHFFHMPDSHVQFLDQKEMFGSEVTAKFPTVEYDLVEAGNCYAMGRSTATVFHLMRVMEIGVQQFGAKLGVTLADQKVWQNILDEINREIKKLPAKDPKTVEMTQVAANLYAVKLAWRNEVMHPKDTYTLEEAGNLIGQVKIFMQQLAKIL